MWLSAKFSKIFLLISIVAVVQAWSIFAWCGEPRGPAFIAAGETLEMPAGWLDKPVRYEKWAEGADMAVTLDQHLYPALVDRINRYAESHEITIAVREGTCGISGGALSEKSADITGFCCPPGKSDRFPGVRYHTIAIGALAMFVHPDNPVESLTYEQAQQIYQGRIINWSELRTPAGRPAPNLPIKLIGRLHCKNRPGHWRNLLDNEDVFSPRLHEVGTIEDVMLQVAADPMTIGGFETLYMGYHVYARNKAELSSSAHTKHRYEMIKALKIDGIRPDDLEGLARGEYPLYFTYNISTWEKSGNPHVEKFVEFLIGQAQAVEDKYYMIPAKVLRRNGWKFHNNELIGEPGS